jgi:diguanylate cyclase (GGDEF)-like protein
MPTLVRLLLSVRRGARAALPLACAAGLAALVVADAAEPLPGTAAIAAGVTLAALLAARARRRAKGGGGRALRDLEIGALVVIAAFAVVLRLDGSLDGSAYPIVFLAIGLVSAFARPVASVLAAALSIGLEVAIRCLARGASPVEAAPHAGFLLAFASLNAAVLRAELARLRGASHARLSAEIERLRDDARSFRLLGAPSGSGPRDEDRLARSGVEEIHLSVLFALRLLRESLGLHTAMLLWLNDAGTHLRISELASDSPELTEGPFLAGDGVLGAALARRSAVAVAGLRPSYKLPYYAGHCPVAAVLALPVLEQGAARGVLIVDRVEDRPFSPREEEIVAEASRYALRAIQNERAIVQLERAKAEQGKLYRAAEALGAATSEADVVDAGLTSAREITSVDFAAITLFDEKTKMHEIRAVSGDGADALVGARFRPNAGLVSMVLENRHPLPYRGEYDERHQVVFSRRLAPRAMPSIVVLPLFVHDRPLGTLVLGSHRRGVFHDAARSMLEVLASHMAVSLSNARMLRRLEDLATTDGLTGLLNKRAMLEVAEQKILAAKRFGRHMSVLVTDIDHFKRVNDTHGHDVGDVIIKGLGDILRRAKRTTDAVARFGGEEFVIICEETDARGAMLLAERVREELERATFLAKAHATDDPTAPLPLPARSGRTPPPPAAAPSIQVTCSIGIATFPEAGGTWEELFKAADEALYVSKRSGRNRSTAWAPPSPRGATPPPKGAPQKERGKPAKNAA